MPTRPRPSRCVRPRPKTSLLHVEDGQAPHVFGEVDLASAAWMVHPHAVYLHEGQQYFVQELDLEPQRRHAHPGGARLLHRTAAPDRGQPDRNTELRVRRYPGGGTKALR